MSKHLLAHWWRLVKWDFKWLGIAMVAMALTVTVGVLISDSVKDRAPITKECGQ